MYTRLLTQLSLQRVSRIFVLPFFAFFFTFSSIQAITITQAEAGIGKKLKVGKKVFRKVEKVGRKLSKKKGIVGKVGKGLQKGGRAGRKSTGKVLKGMNRAKRVVNKQLSKSKAGRAVQKGARIYKKARKSTLNRAFKRCKASVCDDIKDGVDAYVPG